MQALQEALEPEPEPETVIHLNRNRYEPEPVRTGTGMSRNRSVSIRNITVHLINDKNISITETCIVFIGASAGNNLRRIYCDAESGYLAYKGFKGLL